MLAAGSEALWYLTRGTGLVSVLLLTLVVVLGVAQVRQWASEGWPQLVVAGLHKNASLLVVAFLAVHIASTVIDGFAPIDWLDAVIPFTSAYRPIWLGLGALAFDLLLAIVATSLLRRHLGYRAWRCVHWFAYASWPIALVHGLGTGTDGSTAWVLAVYGMCIAAVLAAVAWRIAATRTASNGRRLAAGLLTGSVTALIVTWTFAGPASAGWARRAGTPDDLLSADASDGAASGGTALPTADFAPPFTAQLSGPLTERRTRDGLTHLVIEGTLMGGVTGHLHLELAGPATTGGGLRMQTSLLTVGPDAEPARWTGQVSTLRDSNLTALVHDQAGTAISVAIDLQLDDAVGTATGTVTTQ